MLAELGHAKVADPGRRESTAHSGCGRGPDDRPERHRPRMMGGGSRLAGWLPSAARAMSTSGAMTEAEGKRVVLLLSDPAAASSCDASVDDYTLRYGVVISTVPSGSGIRW